MDQAGLWRQDPAVRGLDGISATVTFPPLRPGNAIPNGYRCALFDRRVLRERKFPFLLNLTFRDIVQLPREIQIPEDDLSVFEAPPEDGGGT